MIATFALHCDPRDFSFLAVAAAATDPPLHERGASANNFPCLLRSWRRGGIHAEMECRILLETPSRERKMKKVNILIFSRNLRHLT